VKRHLAWVLSALVVLAAVGAGDGAWALTRQHLNPLPQISAYSHGTTLRVDPYLYCSVVNLDDCVKPGVQGQLAVSPRYPSQRSVRPRVGQAPWRRLRVSEGVNNTVESAFRPGSRLAVTVPTVDPQRGRIVGLVVQLVTLVKDQNGELHDLPHAEWSVKLNWN